MSETNQAKKGKRPVFAIVVGGGPAPGINGVISAATIEAINQGCRVLGVMDGFKWLAQGDTTHVQELGIDDVSRIHLQGGSILRTARTNPTKSPEMMNNAVGALMNLGVTHLITIGGDDTAYSSMKLDEATGDAMLSAHVPKTIDNDLPLPEGIPTFGYQTARHVGVGIVETLMEDAKTTGRWYFLVAMGRTAGHLAMGIGKASGATITLIPEDFGDRQVTLREISDILEGSIVKRISNGRDFGVAILAEGLASRIPEEDLAKFGTVEHDEHGHIRLSEINLGQVVKDTVRGELKDMGINLTIVSKDLGYELRCADPIPFDSEYTRTLGYGAVKFLLGGGHSAMISVQGGHLVPIPFSEVLDPVTHKTRVRLVDAKSEAHEVARKYMIMLEAEDLEDQDRLQKIAGVTNMSPESFAKDYGYVTNPR